MISKQKNSYNFGRGHPFTGLPEAKTAAESCRNCPLWKRATQTVFGEGPVPAAVMLIGEQPGDYEDVQGRPFVGPAGKLLDRALDRAGLDRSLAYVTNAVKHFKWEPLGKRRLHKKPTAREVAACRPWLLTELQLVRPRVVVTLGATATASLLGRDFRVTANRGQFFESEYAPNILVTVHPSAILRSQKEERRDLDFERFVEDLRKVTKLLPHWTAGRASTPQRTGVYRIFP
jgi:uracil-DNA glycosylase